MFRKIFCGLCGFFSISLVITIYNEHAERPTSTYMHLYRYMYAYRHIYALIPLLIERNRYLDIHTTMSLTIVYKAEHKHRRVHRALVSQHQTCRCRRMTRRLRWWSWLSRIVSDPHPGAAGRARGGMNRRTCERRLAASRGNGGCGACR